MDRGGKETADEAAARWVARLNARSVTTEELDQFYLWRRTPEHDAAYARAERVWRNARSLADDPEISAVIDAAIERPSREGLWAARARRRLLLAGLVAAPAALAGVAWWTLSQAEIHQTAVGERLAIVLADGTRVDLNSDTRIAVELEPDRRRVVLERGEALFAVRPDAARPFQVVAGDQSVTALGTSFTTRRTSSALQVVLISGKVAVASAGVATLELADPGATAIAQTGKAIERGTIELDLATAWTRGQLLLRQTPLSNAIAEMNRYSPRHIELSDPRLGELKVDGVFDIRDSDSFIAAISTIFELRARNESARILLERKAGAESRK